MISPRRAAWLLLALLSHAALVNAFHHHNIVMAEAGGPARIASHDGDCPVHAPDPAGDSQCLSCHLQRSFVSEARSSAVALDLTARKERPAPAAPVFVSRESARAPSGRAPPLA